LPIQRIIIPHKDVSPEWLCVDFECVSEKYGIVFALYEFEKGVFDESRFFNPFAIYIFEMKDGLAGNIITLKYPFEKDLTCKLNTTTMNGFRLKQNSSTSSIRGNIDKFIATFEMESPAEKVSITEGKIEASYN
jgi:hypothetical protein